uniref:Putative secreted protein n=1 Tax=Anopheles triannulatus TaxID=58253 RepID=A0A2M4B4M8_9DIPT
MTLPSAVVGDGLYVLLIHLSLSNNLTMLLTTRHDQILFLDAVKSPTLLVVVVLGIDTPHLLKNTPQSGIQRHEGVNNCVSPAIRCRLAVELPFNLGQCLEYLYRTNAQPVLSAAATLSLCASISSARRN